MPSPAAIAESLTPAQRDTVRAMAFGFESIDVTGPDVLRPPTMAILARQYLISGQTGCWKITPLGRQVAEHLEKTP